MMCALCAVFLENQIDGLWASPRSLAVSLVRLKENAYDGFMDNPLCCINLDPIPYLIKECLL